MVKGAYGRWNSQPHDHPRSRDTANSWCHERVVGYDLYPTYCQWAGVPMNRLPRGIEGGSLVSLLDDGRGTVHRVRDAMVFHFPHYQSGDGPHTAIFLMNTS